MVVLVDDGPAENIRGLARVIEEQDGPLRVFRLSYRPGAGTLVYLPEILRLARRLGREGTPVGVLHAHVHRMGWAAVLAGAVLRRPVVIAEHSSEWTTRTMSRAGLLRARFAFRSAALVCPVSASLQRAIEGHGIRARFQVVPNAVDVSLFHPGEIDSKTRANSLVNVGIQVPVKGLDVLVRAFAQVAGERHDLVLELVGDGPEAPALRHLARDLNVADRVRFSGAAPPEQVAEALRRSDVFVLSSLSETGPVVVLEALCSGLPVVTTRVGSAPEAIGADGELTDPGDVVGLAQAIERALDRFADFDRRSIAERAASRSSLEAVGRQWDEIYRSLVGPQSPRR